MIVSTTPVIDGQLVVEYMGVITGEAVPGANVFRDRFPGLCEIVGGHSVGFERSLRKVRIGQVEAMYEHGASFVVSDLLKLLGDR